MVLLFRTLAGLVGWVLLLVLAIAGLVVAAFSLGSGDGTWSLPGLAELVRLPELRDTSDGFLENLEAGTDPDAVAALSGAGAVLLGLVLLIGALVSRRERLLVLSRDGEGTLAARRRALSNAAEALAEQPRDVIAAKAKVRPHRTRAGGRLRLRVDRAKTADAKRIRAAVRERIDGLVRATSLRARVSERVPRRGARVR